MSARAVLQAAVTARLAAAPALAGVAVFDAPPVRGGLPHVVVEEAVLVDWSTKSFIGREGRLVVAVHDGGERPVRLRGLAGEVEEAVLSLPPLIGEGWRIAGVTLVRSRMVRGGGDRWRSASEFAVRLYRES